MLCRSPHVVYGMAYPCGKCMPCRINRRREWTNRIILERMCHDEACFVTLTYNDLHLPFNDKMKASLVPDHLRLFMNLLRTRLSRLDGRRVRFFGVGEYGDESERPHYHLALFGLPASVATHDIVSSIWSYGFVYIGELSLWSAQYVAGYCTKKMTNKDDRRLDGRYPEFVRMSRSPGLGVDYMLRLAHDLQKSGFAEVLGDVPGVVESGGKLLPYGRTLRRKLRLLMGRDENAPQCTLDRLQEKLLPMRLAARASKENPSFKKALVASGDGKVAAMEARSQIFKKRRSL